MAVIQIHNFAGAVAARAVVMQRCADYQLSPQETAARRRMTVRALMQGKSAGFAIQAGNRGLRAYTTQGGAV